MKRDDKNFDWLQVEQEQFYTFALIISAFSLKQMKSAMLIRTQTSRRRKFNDRFLFIVFAVFVVAFSISFVLFFFSSTFAFFIDRSQRRRKEARIKLIYILNTWCHKCVRRLNEDVSMICMSSSDFRIKKCEQCFI